MQPSSVCWLCILLPWWIHLSVLVVFVWSLQGFLNIVSCHRHKRHIYLFPSNLNTSYFFILSVAVGRTSNSVLNTSILVPDFVGNAFSFSLLSIMLAVGLSKMAFILLRYVPFILTLIRVFFFFNHEPVLNFIKCFFCIYWDDHVVFCLLLMWLYDIDLRMLYILVNLGWSILVTVYDLLCVVGFGLLIFSWEFLHLC